MAIGRSQGKMRTCNERGWRRTRLGIRPNELHKGLEEFLWNLVHVGEFLGPRQLSVEHLRARAHRHTVCVDTSA